MATACAVLGNSTRLLEGSPQNQQVWRRLNGVSMCEYVFISLYRLGALGELIIFKQLSLFARQLAPCLFLFC
ncbi:hypothetical protein VCRLGP8_240078 [Vibrio crassostreae]|nr:hypothetical protein VCRLGP7_20048 [Vibrio crassostreae]CDT33356.1 hypothetical protein VCRLGP107_460088 [Vibrio crassostreae]CDT39720.1 hypothetical protein VCRLGP8_240078 [Vibrio crassostreae]